MDKTLNNLVDDFSLFDGWEDRYRYLIDLGQKMEPLPESLKADEYKVHGCTSQVWLVPDIKDGRFYFRADSDAMIVKGLIYILYEAYNGKTLDEIVDVDIERAFERLGLDKHLSPNRRNGFFSMTDKIRKMSRAA